MRIRHHRVAGATVAFVVALGLLSAAAANAVTNYGRSSEDLALEDYLHSAEVVSIEDVGQGITEPRRLTLRKDGVERRAIFKSVDIELDQMAHAGRFERNFSDKHVYEAAAYRIDRLVGIGLVPVTVIREVDGRFGSVQLWIENVTSLEAALEEPQTEVGNFDLLLERLMLMYVLDALIYNVDRNYGNVLVNVAEDVFHPIDHSRAFRTTAKPPPINAQTRVPIPDRVAGPLQAFDLDGLREQVGEYLSEDQIRAVVKRRDRLVKMLAKEGLLQS